jgi:hypothetical protein
MQKSGPGGPPQNAPAALKWSREALLAGRFTLKGHFSDRLRERGFILEDARNAILKAIRCEAYPGMPELGGSCWRITGPALAGRGERSTKIEIGVETTVDERGQALIMVTLFNPTKKGGKK